MSTLFPTAIPVVTASGSYVGGIWTKGTPVASTFQGSCQPVTAKDTEARDIGRKDVGKIKVYSGTALAVGIEGSDNSGDIVQWQGSNWEIIQALPYQNSLIPHYKYIAEYRGSL